MASRVVAVMVGSGLVVAAVALGRPQSPGAGASSTRVETAPLDLIPPERFAVPVVLEPVRRVAIMATSDGIVRELGAGVGNSIRDGQEIARLDQAEGKARLKIAEASVKEMTAEMEAARALAAKDAVGVDIAAARLDAARARADLAQLDLDRCTLRAPFAGRLLQTLVSPGQYVAKGSTIAELADVSTLRAVVPIDRTAVKAGSTIEMTSEGRPVAGRVQAILPMPEAFAPLRELATSWAGASILVSNPGGELEPGQRVRMPSMPDGPVTTVAARAVKAPKPAGKPVVQVLRGDYVANVPVHVLGPNGPERTQVTGPFRPNDLLIIESSSPLAAGTFLRFQGSGEAHPVEGVAPRPDEVGDVANIVPPSPSSGRVAPIGKPDAAGSTSAPRPTAPTPKPASPPSPTPAPASEKPKGGGVPF